MDEIIIIPIIVAILVFFKEGGGGRNYEDTKSGVCGYEHIALFIWISSVWNAQTCLFPHLAWPSKDKVRGIYVNLMRALLLIGHIRYVLLENDIWPNITPIFHYQIGMYLAHMPTNQAQVTYV